ncbi:MAG TPA: cellulose binding domain-containing protein, partial [Bryobacteraceae bacterium]|nr:cellulose binding domain-containing protein [Bryobacteraceae bacterium]
MVRWFTVLVVASPLAAQNFNVLYRLDSSWPTGLQAEMSVSNLSGSPVTNWKLAFDYPLLITSIWDAKVATHTGNHYVITGAGWNNNLAAGDTVSFGWIANTYQGAVANPANCAFQEKPVSCGGPVTDVTPPAPPTNLRSPAQTSTTISLSWDASTDNKGGS